MYDVQSTIDNLMLYKKCTIKIVIHCIPNYVKLLISCKIIVGTSSVIFYKTLAMFTEVLSNKKTNLSNSFQYVTA
jgi:hypothetical protein